MWSCSSSQRAEGESLEPSVGFWVWDHGGEQEQAAGCCPACPGVRSGARVPLPSPSARPQGLGTVTALQGCACCPFLAILALGAAGFWHWVAPGPGILAPGTTRSRHPGTGYHRILASLGIPLQQVTASRRDGADATCCSAPAAGWEQSQARCPGGKTPAEATTFPPGKGKSHPVLQLSFLGRLCCPKHWF